MSAWASLPSQNGKTTFAAAVEAALGRLLAENRLRLSERNRRFLAFVVREALAGRGERIKAYTIGVDVFGRDENFDPSIDPIVRIEATRIRAALSDFYRAFGASERIRIAIPPGSYVPVFEETAGAETDSGSSGYSPTAWRLPARECSDFRSAIVVTARSNSCDRAEAALLELLRGSVAARLRTMELRVFLPASSKSIALTQTIDQMLMDGARVYDLDIMLYAAAEDRRQVWQLTDLETGELLDTLLNDRRGPSVLDTAMVEDIVDEAARMIEGALAAEGRRAEAFRPLTAVPSPVRKLPLSGPR